MCDEGSRKGVRGMKRTTTNEIRTIGIRQQVEGMEVAKKLDTEKRECTDEVLPSRRELSEPIDDGDRERKKRGKSSREFRTKPSRCRRHRSTRSA